MGKETLLIVRAFDFAARRHAAQRRKGARREPYVNHLAEVALLVAEAAEGQDAEAVAAGLLHDTIEDTGTTRGELEEAFGAAIASVVAEVTDDKSLDKAARKRLQVETAALKSPRARMVKIADKTSNLRSIAASPPEDWSTARKWEYIEWARSVVDRCRGVNRRLEQQFDEALARARESLLNA
jgi:(p)ppGpp synthase/HD superfamily hydrolase